MTHSAYNEAILYEMERSREAARKSLSTRKFDKPAMLLRTDSSRRRQRSDASSPSLSSPRNSLVASYYGHTSGQEVVPSLIRSRQSTRVASADSGMPGAYSLHGQSAPRSAASSASTAQPSGRHTRRSSEPKWYYGSVPAQEIVGQPKYDPQQFQRYEQIPPPQYIQHAQYFQQQKQQQQQQPRGYARKHSRTHSSSSQHQHQRSASQYEYPIQKSESSYQSHQYQQQPLPKPQPEYQQRSAYQHRQQSQQIQYQQQMQHFHRQYPAQERDHAYNSVEEYKDEEDALEARAGESKSREAKLAYEAQDAYTARYGRGQPAPDPVSRNRASDDRRRSRSPEKSSKNKVSVAATASSKSGSKTTSKGSSNGTTCDRCDKTDHATDACPYFKKGRDKHPDAQRNKMLSMGGDSNGKPVFVQNARVVTMPGDGNCLFHSLSYGLGGAVSAGSLRKEIARFIEHNPKLRIADTPLEDWVRWDSNRSVRDYAQRMARSGWGGGIECAACSHLMKVNVHIYEREKKSTSFFSLSRSSAGGSFKRISCFNIPGVTKTICVVYCGGIHYNALVLSAK